MWCKIILAGLAVVLLLMILAFLIFVGSLWSCFKSAWRKGT